MLREVVIIDEELCDGCGLCIPACHEGALKIVDGKARLISDHLCDGLGDCLGHCPQGAIRVEQREAEAFDEEAVAARKQTPSSPCAGSCPGSRLAQFKPAAAATTGVDQPSALTQWPVQLHLLPPHAPMLRGARLLVAADCVPIAYADFHQKLLRDHSVVIACPKLDDTSGYLEKLTEMIRVNDLAEITIAYMEVPCCAGIVQLVLNARQLAGSNVQVNTVLISVQGSVISRKQIPVEPSASCERGSACC